MQRAEVLPWCVRNCYRGCACFCECHLLYGYQRKCSRCGLVHGVARPSGPAFDLDGLREAEPKHSDNSRCRHGNYQFIESTLPRPKSAAGPGYVEVVEGYARVHGYLETQVGCIPTSWHNNCLQLEGGQIRRSRK